MKKLLVVLVLAGLGLAGLAWWWSRGTTENEAAFTLAPVERGTLRETIGATGAVQPREILVVSSPLSGQVVEMYPAGEVNKAVHEGDALLKLDDRAAQDKLKQTQTQVRQARADQAKAEAMREIAKIEVARAKELQSDNLVAQREVRRAESQLQAAEATVAGATAKVAEAEAGIEMAQLGLDLTVVRVPRGGNHATSSLSRPEYTIIERKVTLGQLIAPPASAQLFTLAGDLSQVQVVAQVNEDDIGKARSGLAATFTVYAYSEGTRFQGKVTEIRPKPQRLQSLVFYETIIDAPNEHDPATGEWKLRPGMTASVEIILRSHADVWKLPRAALEFQPDDRLRSEAARAKLAQWQQRPDRDQWRPVWGLDEHGKPWPILVRLGGTNAAGQPGITEAQFNEVLEWDPDIAPRLDPQNPATHPRVIISGPPPRQAGWLERAKVRIF